jgi:hypothetical protein
LPLAATAGLTDAATIAVKTDAARAHTRRKRVHASQARLRRAIAIDEVNTNRQLRLMNFTSIAMIIIVIAMILTMNFVSLDYLDRSKDVLHNIFLSSVRQVFLIDTAAILRIDSAVRGTPNPRLTDLFYAPGVHASSDPADVVAGIRSHLINTLDEYASISLQADAIATDNADLLRIRNENVVPVSLIDLHGKPSTQYYPLRYASLNFAALARLSLETDVGEQDPGYYYCLYAGMDSIRNAMKDTTGYMTSDLSEVHQELLVFMLVVLFGSVAGVAAVAFFFARPLIVRVETAKTRVLRILHQIPHTFRRNLRRKAMLVYKVIKRDSKGVADNEMEEIAHNDEQEAASGSEATEGNQSQALTQRSEFSSAPSIYSQTSQGFSDMLRRYQQQRRGNAGASLAKMSADATAQANARSLRSGASSDPTSAFTELEIDAVELTNDSLLSRRSVRIIIAKYVAFIMTIALFFGLCSWQVMDRSNSVENAVDVMIISHSRLPDLQLAFYETRQFAFFNYTDLLVTDPYDPTLVLGDFRTAGFHYVDRSTESNRVVLTGDPATGARVPLSEKLQDLHYGNLCAVTPEEMRKYVPNAPDYLFELCPQVAAGAFTRGLSNGLIYCYDQFPTLLQPDAETTLDQYIQSQPPPPGVTEARMLELVQIMEEVDYTINYFLRYYLLYSAALSLEETDAEITYTRTIILVFVAVFSAFLLAFYLAMFQPMTAAIAETANQAKSLMLVIPTEVLRHISAAQQYVDEQISME